jgi:hypothetical protein
VYKWPDGDIFEGDFVDGKRWGKGVLHRSNGEEYDQEWKEAKFEEWNKGLDDDGSEADADTPKQTLNKKRKKPEDEIVRINRENSDSQDDDEDTENNNNGRPIRKHHKIQ